MTAQRDRIRMLRRAVPRRDFRPGDAPSYLLLPVQHHLSVPVAEPAQRHRVLAAGRLRREGDARDHRSAGVFCLHAAHRREHACHVRVCPSYRSVSHKTQVIKRSNSGKAAAVLGLFRSKQTV